MAMRECPSCGVDIDESNDICPICQYEIPKQKSVVKWVAILLVLIFAWPLIQLLMRFLRSL